MAEFMGKIADAVAWKFTDASGAEIFAIRPYGVFHLSFFAAALVVGLLLCIFAHDARERTVRVALVAAGCVLLFLECYKQLVMSRAGGEWRYLWVAFPFQFCTTPMFVMILAGALRPGRFRDGLLVYLSSFSLVAGLAVMIFAGQVFDTSLIGVCVQTMIHHGCMVAIGMWLAVWSRGRIGIRAWVWSLVTFLSLELIAIVLNAVINGAFGPGTVDLFYIASTGTTDIPVIGDVRRALPYPVYLLCYDMTFATASLLFCLAYKLTRRNALPRSAARPDDEERSPEDGGASRV